MRPVILELDGFCSYRAKAQIDFRDSDFFVLVGPTGSGKSTVIDAMVFALYGTVPRWDDRAAVASALAPTATRAIVRLIFDVGGKRYVALRDVRRGGGKTQAVSVKEARLEQFVQAFALGDAEDETVPIATGRDVSRAVENLLGLNFDQFTQSVALPQGEFARFLHAKNADRQDILENLLGYKIYDAIQSAAYGRAAEAKAKAATLDDQLSEFTDVTDEQVAEMAMAASTLCEFQQHVTTVEVPAVKLASEAVSLARSNLESLSVEHALLAAVAMPEGVNELETERQKRATELESAEKAQRATERREQELRENLQTAVPRHELERKLEYWLEVDGLKEKLPDLAREATEAERLLGAAKEARTIAEARAASARDAAANAAQAATQADAAVVAADVELEKLRVVKEPEGIEALGARTIEATAALNEAEEGLTAREDEQRNAAAAIAALPTAELLAAAKSAAEDVISTLVEELEEAVTREAILKSVHEAQAAADAASTSLAGAECSLREAEHADQAAAIRTGLSVGDECPVCGHEIVAVLAHPNDVDLQGLRDAAAAARAESNRAVDSLAELRASQRSAEAAQVRRIQRCEALRLALVENLSALNMAASPAMTHELSTATTERLRDVHDAAAEALARIAGKIEERVSTEQRRQNADTAVADARDAVRSTAEDVNRCRAASREALTALNLARDSVSSLAPPTIDDTAIAASWRELTNWTDAKSQTVAERLESLQAKAKEANDLAAHTNTAKDEAEEAVRLSNEQLTAASLELQRTDTARETARKRVTELDQILMAGSTRDETNAELERVKSLEAQLTEAVKAITTAREAAATARDALAVVEGAITTSRQQLQRLRDPLSQYGAPEVIGTDLATDWDLFVKWTDAEAAARTTQISAQEEVIGEAEKRLGNAATTLSQDLAQHGVEIDEDLSSVALADRAPTAVAAALATAEAALKHAKERRSQAKKMRSEMQAAEETANVAQMLSQLMRANGFPRWLIASALDALLRDASAILLELSGGQFELTRNEQDLLVIDHNDADMSRLVKTLSGGETFQASLALALALSEQVTSLSAAGANKLESIFLDEGFGTLDEATLDIVAGTLENLASSGSRMVGVITHVAALAERIPVRFEVSRDNAGSHIERLAV